jgi:uncharacterized protein YoaH (UPF0181 family)
MIEQLRRRATKKALERIERQIQKYMAEGMSRKAAAERAYKEARDNPRKDFRRFKKLRSMKKKAR